MADFKEGDTVRLKSGGPLMTVSRIDAAADGTVLVVCTWFDEKQTEKGGIYRAGMLNADDGSISFA
jgi:uncharacterized protein YodC (DUF2158 family)